MLQLPLDSIKMTANARDLHCKRLDEIWHQEKLRGDRNSIALVE